MTTMTPDFTADEFLLDYYVGKTPLVRLQRLASHTRATVLAKLEGNNPAGSVKDRPAYNMIMQAERRGQIKPGDTLIEATSGNTGIALAMVAAMRGYKMKLIMPSNMSQERKDAMLAYGAELIEVTPQQGMEGARDLALQMEQDGKGLVLNQFGNPDNVEAHYLTTGPEIWKQTGVKSPILLALWVRPVPLWGYQNILKSRTRISRLWACSHLRVQVLQVFAVGPNNIFLQFLTVAVLTARSTFHRLRLNALCADWLGKRESVPVLHQVERSGLLYSLQKKIRMPSSSV